NDLTPGDVDYACRAVEPITGTGNLIGFGGLVDPSCGSIGTFSSDYVKSFDTTLKDNGGHEGGAFSAIPKTHALPAGSNAIDLAGAFCLGPDGSPLSEDQRGDYRPKGAGCDAGAFER